MNEKATGGKGTMEEQERYDLVCKPSMDNLTDMVKGLATQMNDIHRVIFVGNGEESITNRLARGDEKISNLDRFANRTHVWLSTLSVTVVGGLVVGVILFLIHR